MKCAEQAQKVLYIHRGGEEMSVPFSTGETILEALRRVQGLRPHAPCGGAGRCGKCTVFVQNEAGEEEVLSCKTKAEDGMIVRLPRVGEDQVLDSGVGTVRVDGGQEGFGIACDIGTTTVVCQLVDLTDGQVLASAGEGNAQGPYGADVISRIKAHSDGHGSALTEAIRAQLGRMIGAVCREQGVSPRKIGLMTVAANPTMCHLLTGLSPEGIGVAPFAPASYFGDAYSAQALELPVGGPVYILPSVSGYVGGDITAGMLAAGMDEVQKPVLLLDVGTNGEMVLANGGELLCCACAAGPPIDPDADRGDAAAGTGASGERLRRKHERKSVFCCSGADSDRLPAVSQ